MPALAGQNHPRAPQNTGAGRPQLLEASPRFALGNITGSGDPLALN